MRNTVIVVILTIILGLTTSCIAGLTPSESPSATYSQYELEYKLFDYYPEYFWCDPYLWPIVREDAEKKAAQEEFPGIRANRAEFTAILAQLGLPEKSDYSDEEKLTIFREYKKLNGAIQITSSGNSYSYVIRVGEGQGFVIEGTITRLGSIKETNRESTINTCPICLTKGTLIDTPEGPIPVEQIQTGQRIWTLDSSGLKIVAAVDAVASTPVPSSFQVIKLSLNDGRTVVASAGHPTSSGKRLSEYVPGDILDGASVTGIETVAYEGGRTYDILPSGNTGFYWANGILLSSTLFLP